MWLFEGRIAELKSRVGEGGGGEGGEGGRGSWFRLCLIRPAAGICLSFMGGFKGTVPLDSKYYYWHCIVWILIYFSHFGIIVKVWRMLLRVKAQRPKAVENWPNTASCPAQLKERGRGTMIYTVMGGPYRLSWRNVPSALPRSCSAARFCQTQLLLLLIYY
jgi:hypothetical protein